MLEKPNLEDEKIVACLQKEYGLKISGIIFLPLGADRNTAVYRAESQDGISYFVKLRSGVFDETSVRLPRFLSQRGIAQIIAPLGTISGELWAELEPYKVILYPFIEGRDANQVPLAEAQWIGLGRALKRIHMTSVPEDLARRIRRETFSPRWRDSLKGVLRRLDGIEPAGAVEEELTGFLKERREQAGVLIDRAERLASQLQSRPPEFVLCHYDIHGWNVLVAQSGAFYIVDWDDPIFAPKERDLMFIGNGFYGEWRTPDEEETLFYRGYGRVEVEPAALSYYLTERIVEDLAVECEMILGDRGLVTHGCKNAAWQLLDRREREGAQDREQALRYLKSNFQPGGAIEIAERRNPGSYSPLRRFSGGL